MKKKTALLELLPDVQIFHNAARYALQYNEFYKPEDIIGKKVSILINLAPRKIKGIESQGMILMAEDSTGKLNFVNTVDGGFENGSEIR